MPRLVVANVLGLAGRARGRRRGRLPPVSRPRPGRAFLTEIADCSAGGFVAEVWPHLREAATALFPPPARPRPAPLGPELAARVAWIGTRRPPPSASGGSASSSHVSQGRPPPSRLTTVPPRCSSPRRRAPRTGVAISRRAGARPAGPAGRRPRADERRRAGAAVRLRGPAGRRPGSSGLVAAPGDASCATSRARSGRKDWKSLALQASRFGFEPFELEAWRTATLRVADRFGLLVCGDPAEAAAAIAGAAQAVSGNPAATDLLGFALGDRFAALRRAIEGAER